MKIKIIITLALVAALNTFGQGLVSFQNANLSTQRITTNAVAAGGGTGNMTTAANAFQFQFFWGPDALSLTNASSVFVNSTSSFGVIGGNSSIALSSPGGTPIYLQAFGWTYGLTLAQAQSTVGAFWGSTPVINPTPSTSPAPATPLFGSTASSSQFTGFVLYTVVPEPSTMVLAGLGAASLLLFRRRKQA